MGWWGVMPWDSDTYGDMTDNARASVVAEIEENEPESGEWEESSDVYAWCGFVLKAALMGFMYDQEAILRRATKRAKALLRDEDFLHAWKDPTKAEAAIKFIGDELASQAAEVSTSSYKARARKKRRKAGGR